MRAPNFYAHPGFERAGLRRRETGWILERITDPASLFVPVWRNQNLVVELDNAEPRAVVLGSVAVAPSLTPAEERLAARRGRFSRRRRGAGAFRARSVAARSTARHAAVPGDGGGRIDEARVRFTDLRQLGGRIERREGALLALARAMLFWHARHRFCGLCGNPTRSEEAGHMRRCTDPVCNTMHFPRTDPAVIMLVSDGERALIGRKKHFPPGMYSTLAGFVEPGESLEMAVAREVREETGIEVGAVHYHSSQPWPFPANIMLGFHAQALTTEITVDYGELEDARWLERDWLLSHIDDDTFRMPRLDSIARRLIEDWLHGHIQTG